MGDLCINCGATIGLYQDTCQACGKVAILSCSKCNGPRAKCQDCPRCEA